MLRRNGNIGKSTYQGHDRRGRSPLTSTHIPLLHLLLCANTIAGVALGLPLVIAYLVDRTLPEELFSSTRVLSSCLFACTGLICLIGWRLLGLSRSAYIGCCFALFGLLTVPLPLMGDLLPDGDRIGLTAPIARTAISLAVVLLASRALRSPDVDARVRIGRLMAGFAGVASAIYLVLAGILQLLGDIDRTPIYLVVEAGAATVWLVIGAAFLKRARDGRMGAWVGFTMVLLGLQEVLRLVTVVDPRPWMFAASTLLLVAAGAAISGAGKTLLIILGRQDSSQLRMSVDLRASEGRYAGALDRQEERLHDVRSALAAIRCANGTLTRYASQLDARTRMTLEEALTQELGRLEGLVDPTVDNPLVDFRLADLLEPLVEAERNQASEILVNVGDLSARGRPFDTAAVVQNLIVNARRYAPGSVIVINANRLGDQVQLQVEDSGPGIPERERAVVFERGVRGSTSEGVAGTGLGLFVSSRLMVEQGGSLTLRQGAAGGACFIAALPAATLPAAALPAAANEVEARGVIVRVPLQGQER